MKAFISKSSVNDEEAWMLYNHLRSVGFDCWMDRAILVSGDIWSKEIIAGIDDCDVFLLLHSAHSAASPEVTRELNRALELRRRIMLIKLDDSPFPQNQAYATSGLNYLLALPPFAAHLDTIVDHIQRALGRPAPRVHLGAQPEAAALRSAIDCLTQRDYATATRLLEAFRVGQPLHEDACYYLSLAITAGAITRRLRGDVVNRIEKLVEPFATFDEPNGHFRMLLAVIRHDYYALNRYTEPRPGHAVLLSKPIAASYATRLAFQVLVPADQSILHSLKKTVL